MKINSAPMTEPLGSMSLDIALAVIFFAQIWKIRSTGRHCTGWGLVGHAAREVDLRHAVIKRRL